MYILNQTRRKRINCWSFIILSFIAPYYYRIRSSKLIVLDNSAEPLQCVTCYGHGNTVFGGACMNQICGVGQDRCMATNFHMESIEYSGRAWMMGCQTQQVCEYPPVKACSFLSALTNGEANYTDCKVTCSASNDVMINREGDSFPVTASPSKHSTQSNITL